jgi:hypothetical protein
MQQQDFCSCIGTALLGLRTISPLEQIPNQRSAAISIMHMMAVDAVQVMGSDRAPGTALGD